MESKFVKRTNKNGLQNRSVQETPRMFQYCGTDRNILTFLDEDLQTSLKCFKRKLSQGVVA